MASLAIEQASVSRTATDRFVAWTACSTILWVAVQLALGASTWVVLAMAGAALAALAPVRAFGLSHIVGILFAVIGYYFGYNALFIPSLALRPLDHLLFAPELSASVVLAFTVAASAGALLAKLLFPYLSPLVPPIRSPSTLRRLAVPALLLGFFGLFLNAQGGISASIGAFLSPYLFLALAFELTATLQESGGRRSLSAMGILLVAMVILGTTIVNSKSGLFIAVGAWGVANLAFGRGLRWRAIVPGIAVGVLLTYLFLAINVVRAYREEASPLELVAMTAETTVGLAMGDTDANVQLERMKTDNISRNLAFYSMLYFEDLPVLTERFIMLPYVDAVIRSIPSDGPFAGPSFLTGQIANVLPFFLNPDKDATYVGNTIIINLGLGDAGFNAQPTMGSATELFYAGGFPAVLFGAALLYFLLTVVLSATVGRVAGSAFAIYVVIRYVHFLTVGTSSSLLFFMLRQIPVDIALVMAGAWFIGRSEARARQPAA